MAGTLGLLEYGVRLIGAGEALFEASGMTVPAAFAGLTRRTVANVRRALGDAGRPLSVDDLQQKFFDCLEAGRPELDASGLLTDLQMIERLPSCRVLFEHARKSIAA